MDRLSVCINNQTPLVRFKVDYAHLIEKYGHLPDPLPLDTLQEDVDFHYTPGGVTAMLFPLLKRLIKEKYISNTHWISLSPGGPERTFVDGITLHNVSLPAETLAAYARCKERLWQETHGLETVPMDVGDFVAYANYNWICVHKMFEILDEVDIFYVHDFQQLQTGAMIGLAAPTVFRWHIPFNLERVDKHIRNFILRGMEGFDSIVVSCKRDLEGLIKVGYKGHAYQMYPYINDEVWTLPHPVEVEEFSLNNGIQEEDFVVQMVARMDSMKGQDVAIKAVARLKKRIPGIKLVLIGNGSFSGSKKGGLASSKSQVWLAHLLNLVKELKVEDEVIFTGFLNHECVKRAYARSDVVVVPSLVEGFNLTTIEAWVYKKPVVVSTGAGSSELIMDGENGFTHEPRDEKGLAEKLLAIYKGEEDAVQMGERGHDTAKQCLLEEGMKNEWQVLEETAGRF